MMFIGVSWGYHRILWGYHGIWVGYNKLNMMSGESFIHAMGFLEKGSMGIKKDPYIWRYVFTYHILGHILLGYSLNFRPYVGLIYGRYLQSIGSWNGHRMGNKSLWIEDYPPGWDTPSPQRDDQTKHGLLSGSTLVGGNVCGNKTI